MKISRTLKRLRSEKGITQDDLAKLLFISRQSVSSWENDRTQPDIDMLVKLSEIFDVSVEELIYGKKRNTDLETEKPNHTAMLITVFSILGSLLAGTGIVLIFVTFWEKMPSVSKAIFSFLPLVAGQSAALFVMSKKRNSVPWCEGAGILWSAGIAATLALIFNIFDILIEKPTVLILISVSVFPILLILKCISPLAVFYGCTFSWCLSSANEKNIYFNLFVTVLFIIAGCVFTSYKVKKEEKSLQSIFVQWISVAAAVAFPAFSGSYLDGNLCLTTVSMGSAGICLLMLAIKHEDLSLPYKIPGLVLTSISLCICSLIGVNRKPADSVEAVFLTVCLAAIILTAVFVRPKIKDKFLLFYLIISALALIVLSTHTFMGREKFDIPEFFAVTLELISLVASIMLMISGAKEKKLIPINAGFITIAVNSAIFINASSLGMLTNGIILLIFGAVLLAINLKFSLQNKKTPAAEITEEVQNNE